MSIWSDIGQFLSTIAADAFSAVMESARTAFGGDAEARRRVRFSIALIALSAKMAKADGVVTREEVAAFQEVFHVPAEEMGNVARLYNLAKQDVAGFDTYGRQVRSLFPGDEAGDDAILIDVMDALFHIAKADGVVHENELLFLEELAIVFGFEQAVFERVRARHLSPHEANPYTVLGADPDWSYAELKAHYRKRVRESHPDHLIARGVPVEFIAIANDRLAALNSAWESIENLLERSKPVTVS